MTNTLTKLAIGVVCGYMISTFGFPIHLAVSTIINLFYTPPPTIPGGVPPPPGPFFLASQLTSIVVVLLSSIVAVLSPTPVAAFQRLAFVLVPCILLMMFISVSVLIFGD